MSEFVALPSTVEWKNAGQACDMLVGPCACGAFHFWADVESRAAQALAEFATKPHHTHSCQECGLTWRPAIGPTVGVQFLPGFKNGGVEGASVQKYRDRVIQLESLIARIEMTHVLSPTTRRLVEYVFDTSIAMVESGQFSETVVPLEALVEGLDKAR